jgi:lipopolysaccharide transport system ATP-binding protein
VLLALGAGGYLEPAFLFVDEVRAVGDLEFQRKCLGKMHDVAGSGRTVLFVSHDIAAVNTLCDRAILLHQGQLVKEGVTQDVVDYYLDTNKYRAADHSARDNAELKLHTIAAVQHGRLASTVDCRQPFDITLEYEVAAPLKGSRLSVSLRNHRGETLFGTFDADSATTADYVREPGAYRSTVSIPGKLLKAGRLYVSVGCDIPRQRVVFSAGDVLELEVVDLERDFFSERNRRPGAVAPILDWTHTLLSEDKPAAIGVQRS